MIAQPLPPSPSRFGPAQIAARVLSVVLLLFLFLVGVKALGDGMKLLGADILDSFFAATSNPFVALMVGVLATTLVQSSSVTTAMVVGLVAAPDNPLPIENAVPMIMGANIGTTVTNTIVSLAHVGRPDEFRRAFAVATCHDFFNFIAVAVLLPIELATGFLQRSATAVAMRLGDVGGLEYKSPLKIALKEAVAPLKSLAQYLFESGPAQGAFVAIVAGVLIYACLALLVQVMRSAVQTRMEVYINRFLESRALVAIVVGATVTVMVQSSSITTSLLVPLAGAGILTLRQAFPITLGANIGTTVTALLASLAATGPNARWGIVIALVHLFFNLTATLLVYPIERIRRIPMRLAEGLAIVASRSRRWALIYVIMLFYGIPALFALLNRLFG